MVPLHEQACERWDQVRIDMAAQMLLRAAKLNARGPYQLRALIFAHHARRKILGLTPWDAIFACFEELRVVDENQQTLFGWIIAGLHVHGSVFARQQLSRINVHALANAHQLSYWLVDAEIAAGEGDISRQRAALAKALTLQANIAEQRYLKRRLDSI
jgi:predicted RNA polymerase sigma factor